MLLAASKGIAEAHGGNVNYENEEEQYFSGRGQTKNMEDWLEREGRKSEDSANDSDGNQDDEEEEDLVLMKEIV